MAPTNMPTYLLTWNSKRFPWEDLQESVDEINERGFCSITWSCGVSKRIRRGDRLFMIRLGQKPRGVFASGYAITDVYESQHWDNDSRTACYIDLRLEVLFDPSEKPIFPRANLDEGILQEMHWDSQASGIGIRDEIAVELEKQWLAFLESKNIYERKPLDQTTQNELEYERQQSENEKYFNVESLEDARQIVTASIVRRQGQSSFRRKLLNAYRGRCSITNCDVESALEAAHIIAYRGVETNHPANGLLLRADLHTLFDLYLISIEPETHKVVIAPSLFNTCYEQLKGIRLCLPLEDLYKPDRVALDRHYQEFLNRA